MVKFLKTEVSSFFYESSILLVPGYLEVMKSYIYGKYKNWTLLDNFLVRVSLRRLFLFLLGIVKKNKNLLFFFEEANFSTFKPLFKNTKNFATDSVQEGFNFLEKLSVSKNIGCVIFVGSFDNYSLKAIRKFSFPIVFIGPSSNFSSEYSFYSQLDYTHSNILLKKMLESLFEIHNIYNEKKKTVQKFKGFARSSKKRF